MQKIRTISYLGAVLPKPTSEMSRSGTSTRLFLRFGQNRQLVGKPEQANLTDSKYKSVRQLLEQLNGAAFTVPLAHTDLCSHCNDVTRLRWRHFLYRTDSVRLGRLLFKAAQKSRTGGARKT